MTLGVLFKERNAHLGDWQTSRIKLPATYCARNVQLFDKSAAFIFADLCLDNAFKRTYAIRIIYSPHAYKSVCINTFISLCIFMRGFSPRARFRISGNFLIYK